MVRLLLCQLAKVKGISVEPQNSMGCRIVCYEGDSLVLHCASLLRTILASLAHAHDCVSVQNLRDFSQAKLESEINALFLLHEHVDLYFLFHNLNENNILSDWKKIAAVYSYYRGRQNGTNSACPNYVSFEGWINAGYLKTFFSGMQMNKRSKKVKLCVIQHAALKLSSLFVAIIFKQATGTMILLVYFGSIAI